MEDKNPAIEMDELLFRCLEGVANDAEYEHAWRWVNESSQNMRYYGDMREAWIAAELVKPIDTVRQQQVWSQLEREMQPEKYREKTIRIKYLKWAAAAAIIICVYILGVQTSTKYRNTETAENGYTIEAPTGGKSVMTLIDGTKVWLNAGSTLHFDKSFGEKNRNLTLQGEAYFEVAHDSKRLFLVKTSGISIAALGTAFNVKAYPEEDLIETTLVEGLLRIETNTQSETKIKSMILEPNQKATFYKSRHLLSLNTNDTISVTTEEAVALQNFSKVEISKNVDVQLSTSWKDKRWVVRSERLGTFAAKIERKYDVVLNFENAELEEYKISATLEEETIEQLLNAIRHTVPMDYRIERDQVYLKLNPKLKKKYDRLMKLEEVRGS